jgi:serine/threonine protein kinase
MLHKLKIIHKDIKPDNILFSHNYQRNVLTDFGISHPII